MGLTANSRTAHHQIEPLFLQRWSPRAFTAEPISEASLLAILEAGRWAPSAYNAQPWRFIYARRDTPQWESLLSLLNDFNRSWAQNASALVVLASLKTFTAPNATEAQPSSTHSFDTGAAWAAIAYQATLSGWHAHAMAGFDHDRTRIELAIPDDVAIEAIAAIGRIADKSTLSEILQKREVPSPRKSLSEIAFSGSFLNIEKTSA